MSSQRELRRTLPRPLRTLSAGAVVGVMAAAGAVVAVPGTSAQATTSTEKVVQVVTRTVLGKPVKMLATVSGLSLYIQPTGTCTSASCLHIWPPLVMAAGKTVPTGVFGLKTATLKVGTKTELQVTYAGKRLFRFYTDTGTKVGGNGIGGFVVAKFI